MHSSGTNCEWKRRLEYATSFTASATRSLSQLAIDIPFALVDMLPDDDKSSSFAFIAASAAGFGGRCPREDRHGVLWTLTHVS